MLGRDEVALQELAERRALVAEALREGFSPEDVDQALARRRRGAASPLVDGAARPRGRLVALAPPPAVELLRFVESWAESLPPGWAPSASERAALARAGALLRRAASG